MVTWSATSLPSGGQNREFLGRDGGRDQGRSLVELSGSRTYRQPALPCREPEGSAHRLCGHRVRVLLARLEGDRVEQPSVERLSPFDVALGERGDHLGQLRPQPMSRHAHQPDRTDGHHRQHVNRSSPQ